MNDPISHVQIRHTPGSWDEVIVKGTMVGFVWSGTGNDFIPAGYTGVGLSPTTLHKIADLLEGR
jgi:hypothetical protein